MTINKKMFLQICFPVITRKSSLIIKANSHLKMNLKNNNDNNKSIPESPLLKSGPILKNNQGLVNISSKSIKLLKLLLKQAVNLTNIGLI